MTIQIEEVQKPYVIVLALDSLNGIQTAHIFARHKVPIIAIAKDPAHYGCSTKVCEKILFVDTESEELIAALEELGPTLKHKAVLVPCTDMNMMLISRHRQELEHWYHIVLPQRQVVETLMNKDAFYPYAQENGFPIPSSYVLRSKKEVEDAAATLTFPCILKPSLSALPEWERNSKLKAYKVATAEELLHYYDQVKGYAEKFIVQEWIEGTDSDLYTCNCYFNAQSEPIVTFVARKLRQWPPRIGESCLSEECRADVVVDEAIRLFRKVDMYGLGYMEVKRDKRSGRYFIIEPNIGRPTGQSPVAEAGGVELLYTMYCDVVGLPLPQNLQQKYRSAKWIYLRRDLQSAFYYWRNGELTLDQWWKSLRGRKREALFSWKDPRPFFADWVRSVKLYLQLEERKKRNYRDLFLS